jgi:hypothetical protein
MEMPQQRTSSSAHLTVREDQGLIGVVTIADGQQATEFFADVGETDEIASDAETKSALRAIGAWADLDWDAAVDELDQIRHQSIPTPPLDL